MSIIFGLQNLASFARVRATRDIVQDPRPELVAPESNRAELIEVQRQLVEIVRALESVAEALDVQTRFRLDLPDARSNPALSLDLTETAAFLASTEEINAAPHSFSPFGPDWPLGSTALLTIGGAYDGSNGTGALSFEVRRGGTKGVDNLQIRVRDPLGGILDNVNIRRNDPPDMQYDLTNGLFLTLGAGDLIDDDLTTVDVFANVGSVVNPDNPLGGVRNANPNFQYYAPPDTLPPIVDGAFEINGETISVSASDTINTVIDRVNQSNAGVTAVFNPTTERIEFTQNTLGAAPTVVLQNDTSNFTIATKLDTAVVTPGTDSEAKLAFQDVPAFSSVQSGNALINGIPIAIDPAADSLESVIDKVNASAADVTATFDNTSQVVTIEANQSESVFELDGNGTSLFTALNIPEGRVDPEANGRGISKRRSYEIADAVELLAAEINGLFNNRSFSDRGVTAGDARERLSSAINAFLTENSTFGDDLFGFAFDRSDTAQERGRFSTVDRRTFTTNLQIRGDRVKDIFVGDSATDSLIGLLFSATQQALDDVSRQLGTSGGVIDTFA